MKLIESFDNLFSNYEGHFKQRRTFLRARAMAFSFLLTLGRRTVSRMICTKKEQQKDWTADYDFFGARLWEPDALFAQTLTMCEPYTSWYENGVLTALDDTGYKKTGKKIPGVSTMRDPMSPPYHMNLMRGLRFIQASAIINPGDDLGTARAIPVCFQPAAPAAKPRKNASPEAQAQYKKEQKAKRLSVQGHQVVTKLRWYVDQLAHGANRPLITVVDGSYCNGNFLRNLPKKTVVIARTRKDLSLFSPAAQQHRRGRRRVYGDALPTPEQIRQDNDSYPWRTAKVFAAGKVHEVRYKTVATVLWKRGTRSMPLRLVVIAPLRYRKTKTSRLLYRQPAYLLCTDLQMPVELILQYYFLRWDIEVNHRDEKDLLGVADAQLRNPRSVEYQPQFSVNAYSALLLAAIQAYGPERTEDYLPCPKWRRESDRRPSTLDIVALFRYQALKLELEQDMGLKLQLKQHQEQERKRKRRRKKPRSRIEAKKRGLIDTENVATTHLKLPCSMVTALVHADC